MATTEADLLARIRGVVTDLGYTEAVALDFSRQSVNASDGFVVLKYTGLPPVGGIGFYEEAHGVVEIAVQRPVNQDYQTARQTLLTDGRTLKNALVRDGAVTSGEYAVEDAGCSLDVEAVPTANYLVARLRIPVNFEADL